MFYSYNVTYIGIVNIINSTTYSTIIVLHTCNINICVFLWPRNGQSVKHWGWRESRRESKKARKRLDREGGRQYLGDMRDQRNNRGKTDRQTKMEMDGLVPITDRHGDQPVSQSVSPIH